jgi:hypothetical protein
MSRILLQCLNEDDSDRSAPADVLLREEPDEEEDEEEEDEEEDEGNATDDEGEDGDEDNGGYSVEGISSKQWRG